MFSEEMFLNRVILDNPWWQTGDISNDYRSVTPRLFLDYFYKPHYDFFVRNLLGHINHTKFDLDLLFELHQK